MTTPLENREIRIWRRPEALGLVWAFRAGAAFLIALPIAGAVGATGISRFPGGDARLFESGAMWLVETVRIGRQSIGSAAQTGAFAWLVFAVAALVPLAALLIAMSQRDRLGWGQWFGRAMAHLPAFVLLSGLCLVAQAFVLGLFFLLSTGIGAAFSESLDDRNLWFFRATVGVLCGVLAAVFGIAHDLTRAARVRHDETLRRALAIALGTLRRKFLLSLLSWIAPVASSIAVVVAAAAIVSWLRVEQPGALRWVGALLVHQIAIFSLVVFRASWLAAALRLVGPGATTQSSDAA